MTAAEQHDGKGVLSFAAGKARGVRAPRSS